MKQKILIIDDEVHIVEFIEKYLLSKGFTVSTAFGGKEGLIKAKEELPDLTLLDIRMPERNGLTICKELRQNEETHSLPIIMLSAKTSYDDKIEGIKAGADDYLTKPFDLQELLLRIEKILYYSSIKKESNPLTGLPGNHSIEHEINNKINKNLKYAVCSMDLNNFKSYNDKYGHLKGNRLICQTAKIINKAISKEGTFDDFIGHPGRDKFIIITTPKKADNICSSIIEDFDQSVFSFYAPEDIKQGFSVVSIAIGIATNQYRQFTNPIEVLSVAETVKQYAHSFKTSTYKKNERTK